MLRRFYPFALSLSLLCPLAAPAQTPAVPSVTAPGTSAPTPQKHPHIAGKISAVDAVARTVTLKHGPKITVLSVPDTARIYKPGDEKGQPTGTFADLVVDTRITAAIDGESDAPIAKTIHIRLPKTTTPEAPAAPALP